MSSVTFQIKPDDIDKITNALEKFPGDTEKVINEYLVEAAKDVNMAIVGLIPESDGKKVHAKQSSPLQNKMINLGFVIETKSKFYYLYFPDQAQGTSSKNKPDEFMRKGLDLRYEGIISEMISKIGIKEK